jgi:DNA polymerase-3 subunit chi
LGEVYFYHLTESPLEATLPMLIARARGQGWRIEVRGRDTGRMVRLDEALWQGPDDGFLPHGMAGGLYDALQPVILTVEGQSAGDVACIMAVDGADLGAAEAGLRERACVIFDGNDTLALQRARDQWRTLTGAGIGAKYWAQDDGRWVMKQERAAGGSA